MFLHGVTLKNSLYKYETRSDRELAECMTNTTNEGKTALPTVKPLSFTTN